MDINENMFNTQRKMMSTSQDVNTFALELKNRNLCKLILSKGKALDKYNNYCRLFFQQFYYCLEWCCLIISLNHNYMQFSMRFLSWSHLA